MNAPIANPSFELTSSLRLTRLWHCFGNYTHSVTKSTVLAMIDASGTNVLPINTHALSQSSGPDGLRIGFGNVRYDDVRHEDIILRTVKMLNINHQTSSLMAIEKAKLAFSLTGEEVIKLEVLNPDLITSNDPELIQAVAALQKSGMKLLVLPLIHNRFETAKVLVDMGCRLLRVMGSPIGSGQGIQNRETFARICQIGVPVILDGGVSHVDHVREAVDLGATGCLVNSMLFGNASGPTETLRLFMRDLGNTLSTATTSLEKSGASDAEI